MPYTTTELQEYSTEYVAISEALAPIFEWLFTAVGFQKIFDWFRAHNCFS